ncbi:MAG: 2-amino-4-hydroxy-6-hydroxymethyldihydropteridine diphosphokinase [Aestuariibacter sp.]
MPRIFIGLGSNVDKDVAAVEGAQALQQLFSQVQFSHLYESEAIGFEGENFYNAVIAANTELSLTEVLQQLKDIESHYAHPQQQTGMCSKRLDLDLLLYGETIAETPAVLPRPEILFNAFVLLPLSELAPDMPHPLTGCSFAQHWQQFGHGNQQLWRISNSENNKEWFK